jgi:hypothetical protein
MINLTDRNFWKEFPELIFAPGIEDIYKKDKSTDKTKSSQIMWAIHLCESLESKYYNVPDKYDLVATKFLKDPKFDWSKHNEAVELYRDTALTDAERSLTIWNETMRLRSRSLKEMYVAAFEDKDTDELVKIKSEYEADKIKKTGKNAKSMSDSDEI